MLDRTADGAHDDFGVRGEHYHANGRRNSTRVRRALTYVRDFCRMADDALSR